MTDSPSAVELLDAVVVFLRERVQPQLDAASALDARIAASLLQMVRRELAQPACEKIEEVRRLQSLVGDDCSDLGTLNRRLCEWIAQGRLDSQDAGLRAHLWAVTLAKLAVDQPTQSTYVRTIRLDEADSVAVLTPAPHPSTHVSAASRPHCAAGAGRPR